MQIKCSAHIRANTVCAENEMNRKCAPIERLWLLVTFVWALFVRTAFVDAIVAAVVFSLPLCVPFYRNLLYIYSFGVVLLCHFPLSVQFIERLFYLLCDFTIIASHIFAAKLTHTHEPAHQRRLPARFAFVRRLHSLQPSVVFAGSFFTNFISSLYFV